LVRDAISGLYAQAESEMLNISVRLIDTQTFVNTIML